MKMFLDEDFLLHSTTAKKLYHQYASAMPIIDYHCHLPVEEIAADKKFDNLTQIWLNGDHYKWRAMRANGVNEAYCTGDKSDPEKFQKWAETVPYTLRNPLYHWTHLELRRYFGVDELLNGGNAETIYNHCGQKLKTPEFSVRNLLRKMNVKVICTTDDPVDSLKHHKKMKDDGFEILVLPAYRPDKAIDVQNPGAINEYIRRLERASGINVNSYSTYLDALKQRHDFFAEAGCVISDHGLEQMYNEDYDEKDISKIFEKLINETPLSVKEIKQFRSALLYHFAIWDHEKGWVQQFHLGALRNNNTRALNKLGPDTGWDSIGDFSQGQALARFLDKLDSSDQLAKTILYNLNASDNELFATMAGNFNDGTVAGKIQFGSAWWFHDQKDGMIRQLNALSNMGLLSRMVGMLTDSRSFLSYPRHEYFRRILCNLFGEEIKNGELPDDIEWTGKVIQDICFYNARDYFGFKISDK